MTPYDSVGRFERGVGPEPRYWQVSRDFTPSRALDQTDYCGTCGTVLWRGQPCSTCFPGRAATS